ncbi:hypothetical protein H4218_006284, partial [Coemansia sp. IMI 209128]
MFRIDESTRSIDDMEITMSDSRIKQSEEYLSFGQDILKMIEDKEITGDDGKELLDNKLEELKRRMDKRRKREARHNPSTTTRKKVERDYERLKQKGWDKRDFGMEVVRGSHTVRSDMYSVAIPVVAEFTERAMQMQKDILAKQVKPHTPVLTPDGDINEEFYVRLCGKVETLLDLTDVSSTDCKNIARIIKWNDHVAVITAMKPVKKRLRIQTRKAMKVETSIENEVFVDIEAFSRTLSGNYTQQVPYLVCWADGSFPHEAIKDWSDLDKVLEYWVKMRSRTVEEYS